MYADVLILLIFAVVLVAIFRRLGQPVILAYLFAGMLLGPTAWPSSRVRP